MAKHWWNGSLPARAGVAVSLIVIFALASALSSGLIAKLSEGDAAAINTAGSLRMAIYRMTWKLELEAEHSTEQVRQLTTQFEERLASPALTLELKSNADLHAAYLALQQRWLEELKPALLTGDFEQFPPRAESFVEQLNTFVLLLQKHSEAKQGWVQTIQGLALFVTVVVLMVGIYQLQGTVLAPLQELVNANERFRSGDLSVRVKYDAADELGQVAASFNAMAEAIERSHQTLERRVAEETANLAQANAALQLLYQSSRQLASGIADANELGSLLEKFRNHVPGLQLSLCLHGDGQPAEQLLALHSDRVREICAPENCALCSLRENKNLLSCPVVHQGSELGELRANFDDRPAQNWEAELIQALANLIGTALSLEQQREQEHRLLIFEERAVIARELHDSLAQALSYMKLQVSRLQTLMRRGEPMERLETVSEELREGLNSAYRQLRELLVTFRLSIQEGGLEQALQDTTQEFAERGDFQVRLQVQPLAFSLSASEQIHLLQVAREALSNCARHAGAGEVMVALRQDGEQVELLIEDNGRGLSGDYDQRQHHGLTIMQERARSLGGTISVAANAPRGTRVLLRFRPEFLSLIPHENLT
ncbi:MAG TPA: type IV pili methyl-accepting chemotaxis transducer N-terminal domain-containing protein [Pseudomonas sp.]|nr:type IV pili methyl-accepting chemotaxis transducer N-terminal domain-containing protein [Pseudomonas sp.]